MPLYIRDNTLQIIHDVIQMFQLILDQAFKIDVLIKPHNLFIFFFI